MVLQDVKLCSFTPVTRGCQKKGSHFLFHELRETRAIAPYLYHYKRGQNVFLNLFSIPDGLM